MNLCGFDIGLDKPFFLIAGPCVIESEQLQMDTAGTLREITAARIAGHLVGWMTKPTEAAANPVTPAKVELVGH